jgi:mxaA protein
MKRLLVFVFAMAWDAQGGELPPAVKLLELDTPKPYGHVVGDVVRQTLRLELAEGYRLETSALPRPAAVARWLELRRLTVQEQGGRGYRIELEYQTFRAPLAVARQTVPGFPLTVAGPGGPMTVAVPDTEIGVAPLTPLASGEAAFALRPERWPEAPDSATAARRTLAWGAAALAAGLLWLYLNGRGPWARRVRPFAAALRELERLAGQPWNGTAARSAYASLHRAFDAVWGEPLFAPQLEAFLDKRPEYRPFRAELESFFRASYALFFHARAEILPLSRLTELCRRCLAAERRTL